MLERTHIPEAPWWVVQADDKKRAAQLHPAPARPVPVPRGRAHHEIALPAREVPRFPSAAAVSTSTNCLHRLQHLELPKPRRITPPWPGPMSVKPAAHAKRTRPEHMEVFQPLGREDDAPAAHPVSTPRPSPARLVRSTQVLRSRVAADQAVGARAVGVGSGRRWCRGWVMRSMGGSGD